MNFPDYAGLLARTDAPSGSSWGVFGADDEVGTLNFITPEITRQAAALVQRGRVFNLDHRLDAFQPPVTRHRHQPTHTIFSNSPHHRDDYLDGLYLQGSSQVDSLRHFRHPDHGFYNRTPDEAVTTDSPTIGVNRYAERGIAGRGVLLDIDRHLLRQGRRLDFAGGEPFTVDLLEEVAQAQKVSLRQGDILLMRTGWLDHYFQRMSAAEREACPHRMVCPGLLQSRQTVAWLWDQRVAIAASDNIGVEAIPSVPDSPFVSNYDRQAGTDPIHAGLMHPTLIALLGLCLGELWDLEALAEDCAATGVYECFLSCKPLNLTGGVGSPANAMAIV